MISLGRALDVLGKFVALLGVDRDGFADRLVFNGKGRSSPLAA